jgi:HSP20 family molecular chaperone IbpA
MNGYPRDMFDEMDELFTRLFTRMQENAFSDKIPASGYRIVIQSTGYPGSEPGEPAGQPDVVTTPVPEVHRIDNAVKVIVELPGAGQETIHLDLQENRLVIDAEGPSGPYRATADLPPVESGSLQKTFRNSVLEVTFDLPAGPEVPA